MNIASEVSPRAPKKQTNIESRAAHQSTPAVIAALVTNTAGLLPLGLQPILLGYLASAGRITEAGVGRVSTAEILLLAVGAVVAPSFMNSGQMRAKAAAIALLLAIVDAGMFWAGSEAMIFSQRAIAGLLEGLLLGPALLILTHNTRPERMSGIAQAVSLAPQIAVAYLIPTILAPWLGTSAGFFVLAASAAPAVVAAYWLVDRVPLEATHLRLRVSQWTGKLAILMFAIFVQNMGLGAAWTYLERLSELHGFSSVVAGEAVAASLAFQVAGGLSGAWLGHRLPLRGSLLLGTLVQFAAVIALVLARAPIVFIVATSAFGFFWPGLQPFQVGAAIRLEQTRRVAMLVGPTILAGNALGPLLVSFLVDAWGIRPVFWVAAGMIAFSVGLYALLGQAVVRGGSKNGQ